jgi:acyl carrier protein
MTSGPIIHTITIDRLDLVLAQLREYAGHDAANATGDTELSSIGFSSLDEVEFAMQLETHFGIDIPDEELKTATTCRQLAALFDKKAGALTMPVMDADFAEVPPASTTDADTKAVQAAFKPDTAAAVLRRRLTVERLTGNLVHLIDIDDGEPAFSVSASISAIDFECMCALFGRRFEQGFQAGRDNAWAELRALIGARAAKDSE